MNRRPLRVKNLASPILNISVAIFWLTVVETTSSIRLMKSTAYSFIAAIVIQIILQFAFIANFHGKFKVSKLKLKKHLGDKLGALWFGFPLEVSQPSQLFYIQTFVELFRLMNFSDFVSKECWSWSNRSSKTCSWWWNRLDCLVYICYLFPIQCLCNTRNELYHIIYIKAEILNRFIDEIATRKVSSMLVDDVTWWQLWDVGDSFGHFGHQHDRNSVTNI